MKKNVKFADINYISPFVIAGDLTEVVSVKLFRFFLSGGKLQYFSCKYKDIKRMLMFFLID